MIPYPEGKWHFSILCCSSAHITALHPTAKGVDATIMHFVRSVILPREDYISVGCALDQGIDGDLRDSC